ncbi:hypothetical protein [Glaciimonas soli]|uniref:Uncharacterized protein n=1 Tax=Glaciimonas soli TaxID=2590999 RepID=A0A843YIQ8_9BURK|nr:hypothetical protein [Glaciimonas soli]MQQ99244.1 hypothetical protein [Glaciimonas soli]
MRKFEVKYKAAFDEVAGQVAHSIVEQLKAGNYDASSIANETITTLENSMMVHVRAAMRESGFEIGDDEFVTKDVLTREVSRKTGIDFTDITNKDAVITDIDKHVTNKINTALSTEFVSVMNAETLKAEIVDVIVAQVAKGGIGAVMDGKKAKALRSGVVYAAFDNKTTFTVSVEHRKMMQRIYQKRYKRKHKEVWIN